MVFIKTYIFYHFYQQYLVLLNMAPRNSHPPPKKQDVFDKEKREDAQKGKTHTEDQSAKKKKDEK